MSAWAQAEPARSAPLDAVLAALEQTGSRVKGSGRQYVAQCPAHEDRNPSLSITDAQDRVLLKCHAGCTFDAVTAALGLTPRDLFTDADQPLMSRPVPSVAKMSRPVRQQKLTYPYYDVEGTLVYEVVRTEGPQGKNFSVRTPLGDGGWTAGLNGREPLPYRLPEVVAAVGSGAPVFVVEGEKCADALADLGLVATTAPFGAGKWLASWTAYFSGAAAIYILPDNDPPGAEHADQVAEALAGASDRLLIVDLPGLPHGGDVADWLAAGNSKTDLRQVVRDAQDRQRSVQRDGLTVLIGADDRPQPWPWPEPLDRSVYEHTAAGEWAHYLDEAHVTEADPAAVLIQTLTGLGAMVGLGPHIKHGVTTVPARWFSLVVGETARARKGTSWDAATELLRSVDSSFLTSRVLSGFGSGEALLGPIADPPEEQQNGLVEPPEPDRRLLVTETEFARVIDVAERVGSTLSPNLRDLFDTGPVRNLVKERAIVASRHHVALIGHITAGELRERLSSTAILNGFGNRMLLVAAKRVRLLPHPARIDETVRMPLVSRLHDALEAARGLGELHLTDDAKKRWGELYTAMEGRPLPPLAVSMTGRAPIQTLRIALLLALLRGENRVEVADLDVAAEIVRYGIDTVLHVFGDRLGDEHSDQLLEAAREAGHRGLTGKERSALFGRNVPADRLNEAVGLLTRLSLCALLTVPSGGGRPAQVLVAAEHLDAAVAHHGAFTT